jgi:hypothetical protein
MAAFAALSLSGYAVDAAGVGSSGEALVGVVSSVMLTKREASKMREFGEEEEKRIDQSSSGGLTMEEE